MSSVELSQNAKAFTQGHVKCYATDVDAHATVVYDQMVGRYSTGQAMCHYGADHVHRLLREQAHLRGLLERIVEVAHNPECFSCAEVHRLAHEGLAPAPSPLGDWPSSRAEPPKCATPPGEALSCAPTGATP
jgi:hypothetical protein